MTLRDCIAQYEANKPARAALTPRGAAVAAGRRFANALAVLPAPERTLILAELVVGLNGPSEGDTYGLTVSSPPVRDPQIA